MKSTLEFWVFLPQMRMTMDQLVERARAAEAAGFGGIASMDHLAPPGAEGSPMFEAMITSAWLAGGPTAFVSDRSSSATPSGTRRSWLVRPSQSTTPPEDGSSSESDGDPLPMSSRHSALAHPCREARLSRLEESLEIIRALWGGETLDYEGEHFRLTARSSSPVLSGRSRSSSAAPAREPCGWSPPMRTGGTCTSASSTSWTRCDRSPAQRAVRYRCRSPSFLPRADREDIERTAHRRFGPTPIVGTATELVDYFGSLCARGIERVYVWFCDFAPPDTLSAFGETVIGQLGQIA